jgi:predicted transposase YdaD
VQEPQGRVDYDQTLKHLLTEAHDGFLALIAPGARWRGTLSTELPAVKRQADLLWEVTGEDGEASVVHVELQTAVERDIGERLAEYGTGLWRLYHLPVRSVVVFLREAARTPTSPFVMSLSGQERLRYAFDVVRLWELPQELVLDTEHVALWPLAGLMAGVTAETTLAVATRIAASPLPLAERRELTALLAVLASRRLSAGAVSAVLRSNQMLEELLRESPLIEELLRDSPLAEQLEEKGRELGRQEGRQEGRLEGLREMAQVALQGRFGAVPDDVTAAILQADEETLRSIVAHASTESWEDVRSRLKLR